MANRFALVMGVSEYGEGFEPLPGSLLDVREMERVLADPDCGAFQVKKLENPDRGVMETAIGQFFQNRQAEDFLLLYFSGHGDLGSGGLAHQRLHFCGKSSYKENKRLVDWSALSARFLKERMELCKAKQIVVILDCCYSGAIAEVLKGGEEIDFSELRAKGRVILASSSASNPALQERDGLSLYTRYLLEGMAGAAYPGRGEWIVARDLHNHADRRFEIEQKGVYQPKIIAEDTGFDLPVVKAPKLDASLEYRKAVDELFRELDAELGLEFDGAIGDPLDRGRLDTLRDRINLSVEDAQAIEQAVQAPYLVRTKKRQTYAGYFKQAIQSGNSLSDRQQRNLDAIWFNIGLGKADDRVEIEQWVAKQLGVSIPLVSSESQKTKRSSNTTAVSSSPVTQQSIQKGAISTPQFSFETVTLKVEMLTSGFLGMKSTAKLIQQKRSGTAEHFIEDLGGGVTIEMVRIPAGEFMMGSPKEEEGRFDRESPQHKVKVPEFWMGKFQVTQAQWSAIAKLPKTNQDLDLDPSHFKGKNLPVEQVSWLDAIEWCDRLAKKTGKAYRLPSEAEWEYACRAGTTTPFNFGGTISTDLANYDGNHTYGNGVEGEYREKTIDVGSFPPNPFGLFDMHGNVWEWCADLWHENYQGAPIDGSAWGDRSLKPDERRVVRGGSWSSRPRNCRSARRDRPLADPRNRYYGFRLVCPPPGSLQ
jgi:formylglycine-generating enzyme required for sulfatase activity